MLLPMLVAITNFLKKIEIAGFLRAGHTHIRIYLASERSERDTIRGVQI